MIDNLIEKREYFNVILFPKFLEYIYNRWDSDVYDDRYSRYDTALIVEGFISIRYEGEYRWSMNGSEYTWFLLQQ